MDDEVGADASGHTSSRMSGRIEIIARVSGRRYWSVEQKLTMLHDAFGPGGSVRSAMERHDVTSGLLYTWRRSAMAGMLLDRSVRTLPPAIEAATGGGFAEVIIADPVVPALPAALLTIAQNDPLVDRCGPWWDRFRKRTERRRYLSCVFRLGVGLQENAKVRFCPDRPAKKYCGRSPPMRG